MIDDLAILDRAFLQRGRAPELAPAGRICEWCDTVLSRYNLSPWCSVHEGPARELQRVKVGEFLTKAAKPWFAEIPDQPTFRCAGRCEGAYPIQYQWVTADQRFCAWCKPDGARRSDRLELAC